MAVAFDAVSFPPIADTDFSWTHTPVGTPRGVIVWVAQGNVAVDYVATVTYGGVEMIEMASSPLIKTAAETMVLYGYFLGSGIPAGAQTIIVTATDGNLKQAVAITVTAAGDTEVSGEATILSDSQASPSVVLDIGGKTSFVSLGACSGFNNVGSITTLSGWTSVEEEDLGNKVGYFARYNTIGSANVSCGYTASAEDVGLIAAGVSEIAGAGGTVNEKTLSDSIESIQDGGGFSSKHFRPGDRITSFSEQLFLLSAFGRILADNFSPVDQVTVTKSVRKLLNDAASVEDANEILRESFRQVSDFLTIEDFVEKTVVRGASSEVFVKIIEDGIPLVDDVGLIFSGTNNRLLTDTVSLSDVRFMRAAVLVADYFPVFDGASAARYGKNEKTLSDVLVMSDNTSSRASRSRVISDQTSLTDELEAGFQAPPKKHEFLFSESIEVVDSILAEKVFPPVPSSILFGIEEQ